MLAYHELSGVAERDVYVLSPEVFRRHVELAKSIRGIQDCITFDDGHISQRELAAPILNECGVSAIFFITSAWVGLVNSLVNWDDLRELCKSGHRIASHTHTHALLTNCSSAALRNELVVSKALLEDRLGEEVDSISMPGGRVDAKVLAACKRAGYHRVYTSQVGQYYPASQSAPEVIGRYVVTRASRDKTIAAYLREEGHIYMSLKCKAGAKRFIKKIVGDSLYQKAWRKAVRSQSRGI